MAAHMDLEPGIQKNIAVLFSRQQKYPSVAHLHRHSVQLFGLRMCPLNYFEDFYVVLHFLRSP